MRLLPIVRSAFPFIVFTVVAVCFSGCGTMSDFLVTKVPEYREGEVSIVVELQEQEAYLYRGKTRIASSRISTGREGHHTPVGRFSVLQKDRDHSSSVYGYYADASGRPVKEGIDNRKHAKPANTHFVGASMPFYLEFKPGYGLHQGFLPGYPASHGCVRMPYWKARQFYDAAEIGTTVIVKR